MTSFVVDASVFIEALFGTSRSAPLIGLMEGAKISLHAPALCDVEVTSALVRLVRERVISAERAAGALTDYLDLAIERHGHQALLQRALELRNNFTPYDAVYVALSERLGAPLLTADTRLARAVRLQTSVRVLPEG